MAILRGCRRLDATHLLDQVYKDIADRSTSFSSKARKLGDTKHSQSHRPTGSLPNHVKDCTIDTSTAAYLVQLGGPLIALFDRPFIYSLFRMRLVTSQLANTIFPCILHDTSSMW